MLNDPFSGIGREAGAEGTFNVSGVIQTLSFSFDFRTSGPFSSVGFTVDDSDGGQLAGFTSLTPDGTWQTITVNGLVQSDFSDRDFSGNAPLSFGFSFLSSGSLTDDGNEIYTPETYGIDVDNFIVTATLVPEPTSLVLFGVMGLGLVAKRSRR